MEAVPLAASKKNAAKLRAHLLFLDESGFLLVPPIQRTWAPRGQTPILRHVYRRDKLSVISAISVSPLRRRLRLYFRIQAENVRQVDVAFFLRQLLRHLRGHVMLLWDQASQHGGKPIRALCRRHPRLHLETFPTYAPELNPTEGVWRHGKHRLANGAPLDLDDLLGDVSGALEELRVSPKLLRACLEHADLPSILA